MMVLCKQGLRDMTSLREMRARSAQMNGGLVTNKVPGELVL